MSTLGNALRQKFKTPQEAIVALGLDPSLLATDSMEKTKMKLSRKAEIVHGALVAYLAPKLAKDAKVDLTLAFDGVTTKNYVKQRPVIVEAVGKLTKDKLASDAKLSDLPNVLMAFDAMEPEEEKEKAKDSEDLPETGGGKGKGPAKDEAGNGLKEMLKGKLSASDWKAACDEIDDMMGAGEAEDDKDEEDENPDPEKTNKTNGKDKAKDKAKDEEKEDDKPVDKKAMDAAIKQATDAALERAKGVRDAERFVRPWVGDIAIACDSAEDVYKTALEMRGKSTKGIHPSAFKSILEMLPKAGEQQRNSNSPRLGMDGSGGKSFAEMYPGADKIKVSA